jgi:hypothetical protein
MHTHKQKSKWNIQHVSNTFRWQLPSGLYYYTKMFYSNITIFLNFMFIQWKCAFIVLTTTHRNTLMITCIPITKGKKIVFSFCNAIWNSMIMVTMDKTEGMWDIYSNPTPFYTLQNLWLHSLTFTLLTVETRLSITTHTYPITFWTAAIVLNTYRKVHKSNILR